MWREAIVAYQKAVLAIAYRTEENHWNIDHGKWAPGKDWNLDTHEYEMGVTSTKTNQTFTSGRQLECAQHYCHLDIKLDTYSFTHKSYVVDTHRVKKASVEQQRTDEILYTADQCLEYAQQVYCWKYETVYPIWAYCNPTKCNSLLHVSKHEISSAFFAISF